MNRTITLVILLLSIAMHSQNFEWVKTPVINFSWNHDMIGYCTTIDPSGNIYFTGFKDNAFAYEEIMGDQYYNKYSASGELLFSKQFTGKVNIEYITSDSQGNVLMAVAYLNTLSIDNLSLNNNAQDVQYHLFKFAPSGTLMWQQQITINDWFVNGFMSIALDGDDNIYIGYDDFQNSYIRKMTPAGEDLFTISQINAGRISSISIDNEGNIYAAGSCVGPNSLFGNEVAGTDFEYNTYIVKYSPTGVFGWLKFVEDITCPAPQVKAFSPEEVYFSSQLYNTCVFDDLAVEGPVNSSEDMFITKLNANGDYQWIREVPGSGSLTTGTRKSLELDHEGNIYFSGKVRGDINWGNNITTSSSPMSGDVIVLKYDTDGNILMAKTAGGAGDDRADCIAVSHSGDIYVSGMAMGSALFDGIVTTGSTNFYPFLAKLSTGTLDSPGSLNMPDALIYPNPASDYIMIKNVENGTTGTIYNMLGQAVRKLKMSSDKFTVIDLAPGTYLIRFEGHQPIKLIKD